MLGHGDSSFARTLGRWGGVLLPALLISGLSLSGAHADPRIDGETGPAMTKAAAPQIAEEIGPEVTPAAASHGAEESGPAVADAVGPQAEDRVCSAVPVQQQGVASWYGRHWRGRKTASGQRYDERLLTAASRSLPLPTRARVTNLKNGRSVDVLVNDRGPYVGGRIMDLSAKAAQVLGITRTGLGQVAITAL